MYLCMCACVYSETTVKKNHMDLYRAILRNPRLNVVSKNAGTGGFSTCVSVVDDEGVPVRDTMEVRLKGITETLRDTFWPDYVRVYIAASQLPPTPLRGTTTGPIYATRAPLSTKRTKSHPKRSFRSRMREGLAIGNRVHHELHVYTSGMNFALRGFSNIQQRASVVFDSLSQNGKTGGIHTCTRAILSAMDTDWKWVPLAAEWCVGDVTNQFKHATQIDMIACKKDPTEKRLLVCEVKTGYNEGAFFRSSGPMHNMLGAVVPNTPLSQAKMQLVMGTAMFCSTYGLKWDDVEMHVIYCPSKVAHGRVAPKPTEHAVTKQERGVFLRALRAAKIL